MAKTFASLLGKLWFRVLLGLALGIAFGFAVSPLGKESFLGMDGKTFLTEYVKPVGTVFINLIKMVVVPLIFFSLISGIVSMTNAEAFKRIGLKAVGAFLMTGAFAVCIGLLFGTLFHPGEGVDLSALKAHAGKAAAKLNFTDMFVNIQQEGEWKMLPLSDLLGKASSIPAPQEFSIVQLLVSIIPTNIVKAMADDNILQVVVFAIFVGITLNKLGPKVQNLIELFQQAAILVFKLIETIIKFSPYGVFALTSWVVGTQGMDILIALLKLVGTVVGALFTQYLLFGLMIMVFGRMSPMPFYRKMVEPQLLAFSTSSSKATLSTAMRVVNERIGVSKSCTSFVLPLGASINMDGTAIYLGICALFFSQAYGIPIDAHHYIILVLTATLGSIGAAGIPGGSLIMMGMVLTSVGLPLEGIALIAGVDRILDMLRTTVNITGDSVITLLVDKSEYTFDRQLYHDMDR